MALIIVPNHHYIEYLSIIKSQFCSKIYRVELSYTKPRPYEVLLSRTYTIELLVIIAVFDFTARQ